MRLLHVLDLLGMFHLDHIKLLGEFELLRHQLVHLLEVLFLSASQVFLQRVYGPIEVQN